MRRIPQVIVVSAVSGLAALSAISAISVISAISMLSACAEKRFWWLFMPNLRNEFLVTERLLFVAFAR